MTHIRQLLTHIRQVFETNYCGAVYVPAVKDSFILFFLVSMCELIQERHKSPWLWPDMIYNMTSSGRKHQKALNILHAFTHKVHYFNQNTISNKL